MEVSMKHEVRTPDLPTCWESMSQKILKQLVQRDSHVYCCSWFYPHENICAHPHDYLAVRAAQGIYSDNYVLPACNIVPHIGNFYISDLLSCIMWSQLHKPLKYLLNKLFISTDVCYYCPYVYKLHSFDRAWYSISWFVFALQWILVAHIHSSND